MLKSITKIIKLALAYNNRARMLDILITFKPWFFKLYSLVYPLLSERLNEVIISSIAYADMPASTKVQLLINLNPKSLVLKAAQLEAIDWSVSHYDLEMLEKASGYLHQVRDEYADIAALASSIAARLDILCAH